MSTRRTGLHISAGGVLEEDGTPLPDFEDLDAVEAALAEARARRAARMHLSDRAVQADAFLDGYVAERRLGRGTYGTAFLCRCTVDGAYSVVKLANALVDDAVALPQPVRHLQARPDPGSRAYRNRLAEARLELRTECWHAELLLEPAITRALRMRMYARVTGGLVHNHDDGSGALAYLETECFNAPDKYDEAAAEMVGLPLRGLSEVEFYRLVAAQAQLRTHPGFYHIHSVQHFDWSIPALVSAPLDGSLGSLWAQSGSDPKLREALTLRPPDWVAPYLWVNIAMQIGEAMRYMEAWTPVAHIDLKPDNMLYRRNPHPDPDVWDVTCVIADFGMVVAHDEPIPRLTAATRRNYRSFMGTRCFVPPFDQAYPAWFTGSATARSLSEFQYVAAMASMLLFARGEHEAGQKLALTSAPTVSELLQRLDRDPTEPVSQLRRYLAWHNRADAVKCLTYLFAVLVVHQGDPQAVSEYFHKFLDALPLAVGAHASAAASEDAAACEAARARVDRANALLQEAEARDAAPHLDITEEELRFADRAPEHDILVDA